MTDNNEWTPRRRFVTKQLNYRNPYFPRETISDKKRRHRRYISVLAVIIVISLVYVLFFSSLFEIREITVEGGTTDRISLIESRIDSYLQEKSLGFIENDNWFISSDLKVKNWLDHDLSDKLSLESLKVSKSFPHTILIIFRERTAQLVLDVNGRTYLLDNQGYVISGQYINPAVVSDEGEPVIDDQFKPKYPTVRYNPESAVVVGQQIITSSMAQSIIETNRIFLEKYQELPIKNFDIVIRDCPKISITDNANQNINANINNTSNSNTNSADILEEREIITCTEQPMVEYLLIVEPDVEIYFSTMLSSQQQINTFHIAYEKKLDNIFSKLQYIDLRYPGRVYYK